MGEEIKTQIGSGENDEVVRAYLLGTLIDERRMQEIELKLLTDDDFAEGLSAREDALIEEYLDDGLSDSERTSFEKLLSVSADIRKRLRLIVGLRKIASQEAPAAPAAKFVEKRSSIFDLFKLPVIRYAGTAVALVLIGFLGWRIAFYRSDADHGLEQLRAAYSGKRVTESRPTSGIPYAPLIVTRGSEPTSPADATALTKAKSLILGAVADSPNSPDTLRALGLLHLSEHNYAAARTELEKAVQLEPKDPRILNDLGTVRFEMAKHADGTASFRELSEALKYFDDAIAIEPGFAEALFNRALTLQQLGLHHQAAAAWEAFLEVDAASEWADEARKNLEKVKAAADKSSIDPTIILGNFIDAFRSGDRERAWQITRDTKELVSGTILVPALAKRIVAEDKAFPSRDEALAALVFLGEIEKEKTGDPFAAELAKHLASMSPEERRLTAEAERSMEQGYRHLKASEWSQALSAFESAGKHFFDVRNTWEAEIAEFQTCYVLTQMSRISESNERLSQLLERSRKKGHKWMAALAGGWMASNYSLLSEHSKAVGFGNEALKLFIEISDTYSAQRTANQLTHQYYLLGDEAKVFSLIERYADTSGYYYQSPRQTSRNLLFATQGLYTFEYFNAARAFAAENLHVAGDVLNDNWLTHTAKTNLAVIYGAEGAYPLAIREIEECFRIVEAFEDPAMRSRQRTRTTLILARLQRESGNCFDAVRNYDQVIEEYSSSGIAISIYEARKGKLLCSIGSGDNAAVEQELPELIGLFESNRQKIAEEQDRSIFFDREQTVYDIAVEYAFSRLNDSERAFAYVERSRARGLLGEVATAETQPLGLKEFQALVPAGVQVIYYAMLPERLLAWRISSAEAEVISISSTAGSLAKQVREYNEAITARGATDSHSKELYSHLITPIREKLSGSDTVCIVADKALLTLAFASLRSPDSGKYLVEEFPITYTPSATIFAKLFAAPHERTPTENESIFAVGNPSFLKAENPGLADLKDAEREAQGIARFYPERKVLVAGEATRQAILRQIGSADVFHFAGHYVSGRTGKDGSRLVTADGDIEINEIARLRPLKMKIAILSACNSGIENYLGGEGMVGASRSFLAAGVPLVIGSQWAVDSATTADLMTGFHGYRKQNNLPAHEALRRSQIDMISSADVSKNHPYFWAAFMPIGGLNTHL